MAGIVIPGEADGCDLPAQVAVDALMVDIERAGCVADVAQRDIRHGQDAFARAASAFTGWRQRR